jgi:SAM-dependent methyltransferase
MGPAAFAVAESNRGQLEAWDGDEGGYWAAHADYFDRSIALYHAPFLDAPAIGGTDRVLDIGCGNGQTTLDAASRAAAGNVVGVDLSSRMLDVARRRAEKRGISNVEFLQVDAQTHAFEPESFDVAIGRTSAMFFGDHAAAFSNIGHALTPEGRLALLTWQPLEHNEWIAAIGAALAAGRAMGPPPPDAGPFALSSPDRVRSLLTEAGFVDVELEGRSEPMWFGADTDEAHRVILGLMGWMLRGADDDTRARGVDNLRDTMAAHETAAGVLFGSATWIVTARRSPHAQ